MRSANILQIACDYPLEDLASSRPVTTFIDPTSGTKVKVGEGSRPASHRQPAFKFHKKRLTTFDWLIELSTFNAVSMTAAD